MMTLALVELAQALDKLADVIGAVQLTYFPTARPTGNRDRNRRFVDIHSHEDGIVHQVRPPCLRLCAGLSDAILDWDMPWDGPPDASHSGHRSRVLGTISPRSTFQFESKLSRAVDCFSQEPGVAIW
jgi:hypothetical protein